MLKGGLMIRMIDVVFILLFGFISISEINPLHSIEPPKVSQTYPERNKANREGVVFVGINSSGSFVTEFAGLGSHTYFAIAGVKDFLREISTLQQSESGEIHVNIYSNWDAPIKYALTIAAFCDEFRLRKSLIVRKIEKPA